MTAPVDQAHVERLVREIIERDRREPGFGRAVVAALVAKLGPAILKPAPRPSDGVDVSSLIG
jgi:hypothetical protein